MRTKPQEQPVFPQKGDVHYNLGDGITQPDLQSSSVAGFALWLEASCLPSLVSISLGLIVDT